MAWCRHYAGAYANELSSKSFFAVVKDESSIQSYFRQHGLDRIDATKMPIARGDETTKRFVGNQRFGAWLRDMVRAMRKHDVDTANFAMFTYDHALALRLRRKSEPERICVTGYDPNVTQNHRRLVVSRAEELRKQTLDDCFPVMSDGWTNERDHLWVLAAGTDVKLAGRERMSYLDKHHFCEVRTALMLGVGVQFEAFTAIKILGGKLKSQDLASMDASNLLRQRLDHAWLLHVASPEALDTYAQALKKLKLRREALLELIVYSHSGLTAGLCQTVIPACSDQEKQQAKETLLKFGRIVRTLKLDPAFTDELLTARNVDGCPALQLAVRNRHSPFVHAFGELLQKLGITGERARPLVAARSGTARRPLFAWDFLSRTDNETAKAYLNLVTRVGVSLEDLMTPSDVRARNASSSAVG